MNNGILRLILLGISLVSFSCLANNNKNTNSEEYQEILNGENNNIKKKTGSETRAVKKIKYIPPFLGAPSSDRLRSMGVRSSENQLDLLFSLLTPSHTGITSQSQPNLYWFTSRPISKSFQFIEFVLNSEESITPILRTRLPLLEKSGIHQVNFANHDIILKPGIEYSWSIALVKKPQARSLDYVSSSKIRYLKADEKLQQRLKESSAGEKALIYAQSGYWYEAIETAIELQKQQPDNLTHLINQVGLEKIAEIIFKKSE